MLESKNYKFELCIDRKATLFHEQLRGYRDLMTGPPQNMFMAKSSTNCLTDGKNEELTMAHTFNKLLFTVLTN